MNGYPCHVKVPDTIIGRDALLKKEVVPRIKKHMPFGLLGQQGIGKTTLLFWCYSHCKAHHKCFVTASMSYSEILNALMQAVGLMRSKQTNHFCERELFKQKSIHLFIDDLDKATPKKILFFKQLNEQNNVYYSAKPPIRELANVLILGKKQIRLHPLDKAFRRELALYFMTEYGSKTDIESCIDYAKGIPARALAVAKGEYIKDSYDRTGDEEINISWILLLVLVLMVIYRYVGREMSDRELYLIGSIGMGFGLMIRLFIFQTQREPR